MPEEPAAVRNTISDGAVVVGGVVQAGSVTGQIHFHYQGDRAPPDLLELRSWLRDVVADYRARVERERDPTGVSHLRRLDAVRAGMDDSPGSANARRDAVRRLLVTGVAAYVARRERLPPPELGEQVLLDLVVFSLWPVVSANRLPRGWQGELAALTSPRLATLAERARAGRARAGQACAAQGGAADFARTVADKSFARAMFTLFDDLGDPRRGGALLTAMAAAAEFPAPPAGRARTVVVWVVGLVGGAAMVDAVLDRGSQLGQLLDAVGDLPVDEFNPAELLADIFEDLFG